MTGTFSGKAPETKRIKNLCQVTTGTFRTNSLVPTGCARYAMICCFWPIESGGFVRDSLVLFIFRGIPFIPPYAAIIGKVPQFMAPSTRDLAAGDKTFKKRCKKTVTGKHMIRSLDTAVAIRTTCANSC